MPGTTRRDFVLTAVAATMVAGPGGRASGETRTGTLRYVTGGVVNTLDPVMLGGTPEATALSSGIYDRLLRFGKKAAGNGTYVFDFEHIEGELAERYEVSQDGLAISLRLRPNATWHDGSPVTVEDVKWSLDRAVSAQTMSKAQLATGSLTSADQITILDSQVVQIRLERADRLAVPNLATLYAPMFNSRLARQHATADDPWATTWLKGNTAGGGAYTVQSFTLGTQMTLIRNDSWTNGKLPSFRRVILQTVPEAATRAELIERGDADLTTGLQAEDLKTLEKSSAVKVISTPMPTGFGALIFNTQMPPFDRVEIRRALSLAVPYDAIFKAALDERGSKLYGARWAREPATAEFPQALPLHTDLDAASKTLADAGFPDGFDTTLSYSMSRAAFADPAAALIQDSFAKIGISLKIQKLPDSQMAQAVTEKRLPMLLERSLAMFPSTEYFLRIFASGQSRWNFSSWRNPLIDDLLSRARYEVDAARYDAIAREMIGIMADQVPMAMIWQPSYDVAMAQGITGFTTWYDYMPDVRDLSRG